MMDQTTLTFVRSKGADPSNSDIEELIAASTKAEYLEMVFKDQVGTFQPRFEFADAASLAALADSLRIEEESLGHLMTLGNVRLDFYSGDELIARIQVVKSLLRWPGRWASDAQMVHAQRLAALLKSKGFPALNDEYEADTKSSLAAARVHRRWLASWEAATPPVLAPLVQALVEDRYAPQPVARPKALAILASNYPTVDQQILVLLAWYGHAKALWSGYPMVESAPESLLESFEPEQILAALQSSTLTPQQLEGACRLVSRYVQKSQATAKQRLIEGIAAGELRHQLLSYISSTNDSAKVTALGRAFG